MRLLLALLLACWTTRALAADHKIELTDEQEKAVQTWLDGVNAQATLDTPTTVDQYLQTQATEQADSKVRSGLTQQAIKSVPIEAWGNLTSDQKQKICGILNLTASDCPK